MDKSTEQTGRTKGRPFLLPVLATASLAAIFAFDYFTPLGVAGGVPYVAVVLLGLLARQPRTVLVLAVIATVMTLVGMLVSPAPVSPMPVVALNRALAIFAIWATGIVSYLHLRSLAELKPLADRDELTGAYNRHFLQGEADKQFNIARRYGHPLSLIMLDIDYFKQINDQYGHPAGDEVLKHLANTLISNCRDIDTVCRYGGEEFVMLLPYTDLKGALATAEQIRHAINRITVPWERQNIRFRVSMGVAEWTESQTTLDDLVVSADQALYTAKESGRDRIVAAPTPGVRSD